MINLKLRLALLDRVGYLSPSLLELRQIGNNTYMLCDAPICIEGKIKNYQLLHSCYLCYNVDCLKNEGVFVNESQVITLNDNRDGTYSEERSEDVKIYLPKHRRK